MPEPTPIRTLLVANRGEIACRILRTAHALGMQSVAVYSDVDADALHVRQAHRAVRLGGAAAADSYLRGAAIIEAALASGADAVHPGYGFLAENADFAAACVAAGLIFVGPSAVAMSVMGSKDAARQRMIEAGVPVVPGADVASVTADPHAAARSVGYPLLLKAAAGGGGKGMRVVHAEADLDAALAAVRREALGAFGDDAVLLERWVTDASHIEVQVFGDAHGNCVHLFDRDCSSQRRHQKVMEEAPALQRSSPELLQAALAAARAVDYVGAGTVEFLATDDEFFFLEMNTRLQVEHPVTECITHLDLVALQLHVAQGLPLPDLIGAQQPDGHAIEVRLCAEDPAAGFLPATGRLVHLQLPEDLPGVRVDTGVRQGDLVSPHYDPMIAKIIAHGRDRLQAMALLRRALAATHVHGVRTNLPLLRALTAHGDSGGAMPVPSTGWLEANLERLLPSSDPDAEQFVLGAVALAAWREAQAAGLDDPFDSLLRFRLNAAPIERIRLGHGDVVRHFTLQRSASGFDVQLDTDQADAVMAVTAVYDAGVLHAEINGMRSTVQVLRDDGAGAPRIVLLGAETDFSFDVLDELDAVLQRDEAVPGSLLAPMPGQVIAVHVGVGDEVAAGDALMVLEAMKMEHTIRAPDAGIVRAVLHAVGSRVEEGVALVEIDPIGAEPAPG